MTRFKQVIVAAGMALGCLAATSAQADVYNYAESGNSGLTIVNVGTAPGQVPFSANLKLDTATGTGSLTGDSGAINIKFTGNFAGFSGGASPTSMFNIVIDPTSSITYRGNVYSLIAPAVSHPDMLEFMGSSITLWAEWSAGCCFGCQTLGDINGNIASWSKATAVPEPGMIGIMGLGVAAMMWRRRKTAAVAA